MSAISHGLNIETLADNSLTITEVMAFSKKARCFVPEDRLRNCQKSYDQLSKIALQTSRSCYGLHTSYGHNVKDKRDPKEFKFWQRDLLQYLQVGLGPGLPPPVVRLALRLQLFKASRGASGIHPKTVERLTDLGNAEALPNVPRYGSLGASGDLIPMAHAVSPLFREEIPGPRDVIGLVNTNAMMGAWAITQFESINHICQRICEITAINSLTLSCPAEHFSGVGFSINPRLEKNMQAAKIISDYRESWRKALGLSHQTALTQAKYSLRCSPQIVGNCLDFLSFAHDKILAEALSVSDNPIIVDGEDEAWHGGLFYAAGIASAADIGIDILAKGAELMDRQVLLLMDSRETSLEDNLWDGTGHLKGIHQLLSSLMQRVKTNTPRAIQASFSCESHNQDVVPGGMTVLNVLQEQLDLLDHVLKAASFVSIRGALQKAGRPVEQNLKLDAWPDWKISPKQSLLSSFYDLADS